MLSLVSKCRTKLPLLTSLKRIAFAQQPSLCLFYENCVEMLIHRIIVQRLRLRIELSEDPSIVGDGCGNGSSGNRGAFSPISRSFPLESIDSGALPPVLFSITEPSAGKSNFPKNSPITTLANNSILKVIEINMSNHPNSCWKPYNRVMIVFRFRLDFPDTYKFRIYGCKYAMPSVTTATIKVQTNVLEQNIGSRLRNSFMQWFDRLIDQCARASNQ